ncbi:MAG: hypothetical protein R6U98_26700 [Pirellulaceae bacterium]
MQRTRTALILGVILVGTTGVRAQTAHSIAYHERTCPRCRGADGGPSSAGGPGRRTSWTATLQRTLGGLLPGCTGCDARHKIYKSALRRSTFDKKLIPVIPYYEHTFPCYSDSRHRTGRHIPGASRPAHYAGSLMEGEMLPMQEIPSGTGQPTPASKPASDQAPGGEAPLEEQSRNLKKSKTRRPAFPKHPPAGPHRQATLEGSGGAEQSETPAKSDLGKFISWDGETESKARASVDSRESPRR